MEKKKSTGYSHVNDIPCGELITLHNLKVAILFICKLYWMFLIDESHSRSFVTGNETNVLYS